ncbi:TlpA disulfide reductase family protein [Acidithrix sp. C25]|uniref:TlpA family protein disulfide reductase n=1 Tax=Acidithrix sp. C25 TaxID=1671482 RepID=UPI00191BC83B|nr:TlpA disulfide reductase family protein [Acidithrix sp. C25]
MSNDLTHDDAEPLVTGQPSEQRRGGRRLRWVLALVAILVVAFSVSVAFLTPTSTSTVAASNLIGQNAPELAGTTLSHLAIAPHPYRGDYLIVNFFASWCIPCRSETGAIESFVRSAKSRPYGSRLAILSVTVNDRRSSATAFVRQTGMFWPVIYDGNGVISLNWGVVNPPQTFIVAPNGKVVTRIVGQVTTATLSSVLSLAYSTYG